MRNHPSLVFVLVLSLLSGVTLAQDPFARWDHFSATRTGGPIVRDPMKIYRAGNQLRADHDDQVHITYMKDLSSVSIVNNKCVRMQLPDGPAFPFSAHFIYKDYKLERTPLEGQETVDGHPCKMETFTYTRIGNEASFIKLTLWEAQDLDGFPIKVDVLPNVRKKPFTIHYSDVSLQTPDPALFKVPARCSGLGGDAVSVGSEGKAPTQTKKPVAKPPAKSAAKPTPNPPSPEGAAVKPQ